MAVLYKNLPETPGVYLMKNTQGRVLYVGKAGNLRRRVSSYFLRPQGARLQKMVSEIKKVDYKKTDSALEALILESELIKKLKPAFNVREKDDKSFLYVEITKEKFPRLFLVRGKDSPSGTRFGPFTSATSIREALRILRRIFPWSTHPPTKLGTSPLVGRYKRLYPESGRRACLNYEIGLCPGTCTGAISRKDYLKNIRNLKLFFKGNKKQILRSLEREMGGASKVLEFERAEKLRRQIFALKHIRDTALISDVGVLSSVDDRNLSGHRIEGYDISNISGTSAVGAMVVFSDGKPDKDEYRKFKIRTVMKPDDVGMLKEVLSRRFERVSSTGINLQKNKGWTLPNLILVDGGRGQVNVVNSVLAECGLRIPVVGIAKGSKRKRNDFVGRVPRDIEKKLLIQVRDEAHRFAISYHKKLRSDIFRT